MKIYTRGGDKGQTSLFGGMRVPKNHTRVEAYGTIDELNSALGIVIANLAPGATAEWLQKVQSDLFCLGSWLASPKASVNLRDGRDPSTGEQLKQELPVNMQTIEAMERQIDLWEADLPPLRNFILPGGGLAGAHLHLARTICRRAERECVRMKELGEETPALVIQYLNRLADALFVLARWVNHKEGKAEIKWT